MEKKLMPRERIPDWIYKKLETCIKALNDSGRWFVERHDGEYWDQYGRNNLSGANAMLRALCEGNLDALMKANVQHNKVQDGYATFDNLEADDILHADTEISDEITCLIIRAKLDSLIDNDPKKSQIISRLRKNGVSEWQVIEHLIGRTWGYEPE